MCYSAFAMQIHNSSQSEQMLDSRGFSWALVQGAILTFCWHFKKGSSILNAGMKATVSGWKSLSNGGVIESKIWPALVSCKRTVFSISTPSTEDYLWCVTVYQKFSPAEKDWEMFIKCWGGMQETKKGIVLSILGRGAERVQKVAAFYWRCCDFQRRSDVLQWGTCWDVSLWGNWRRRFQECSLSKPACCPQLSHFLLLLCPGLLDSYFM